MIPRLLALTLAAVCSLSATSAAQKASSVCPDTKSTTEVGSVTNAGGTTHCGIGVSLFGVRVALFGPECPDKKLFQPTREVCNGEMNEGTQCIPYAMLDVTSESCQCGKYTILGTGLATPECICTPGGVHGYVQGYQTVSCPALP